MNLSSKALLAAIPALIVGGLAYAGVTLWSGSTGDIVFPGLTPTTIDNMVIGGTTPAAGSFTTLTSTSPPSGAGNTANFASPPPIGSTAANTGKFTALNATSIGATTPGTGAFSAVTTTGLETVGSVTVDTGTKTATASGGAATLNKNAGVITSEALTTAGLADYTLTLTDSAIAAADQVMVTVANGTNTQGTVALGTVKPAAGSVVIVVHNLHATQALNGTITIAFVVFKN